MKIAFISYVFPPDTAAGGIATYIKQAADRLQNRGNLVEVFTASRHRSGVETETNGERVKVYWGGFSMVKATLNLMKAALTSGEKFSHLVLLSGLDYPIKPSWAIYNFLTNHSNKQFIRFIDMQESPTPQMKRILHYWFMEPIFPFSFYIDKLIRSILQKLLGLGVFKKPLKNMAPPFGSQ